MNEVQTRMLDFSSGASGTAPQQIITINVPVPADADLNKKTFLTNPNTPPNSFSLNAVVGAGSGIKQLYFGDACGMAEQAGYVGGLNSMEMDYVGVYTPAAIKRALQTHALICMALNFDASNQAQLKNNLQLYVPTVDEDVDKSQIFSAPTVSNMQQNQDLLNIGQAFVWTNQTAMKLNITAPIVVENFSFTFSFLDFVPYGLLSDYLKTSMIPRQTRTLINPGR